VKSELNRTKLFSEPKNLLEAQLDDLFRDPKETNSDTLMKILSIILFKNIHDTTLMDLFKVLGQDYDMFSKIVTLFSDRTIHFPNKEELDEQLLIAVCFYYKEVRNYSWSAIKEILPVEISSVSYSAKIRSVNKFLREEMSKLFEELVNGK